MKFTTTILCMIIPLSAQAQLIKDGGLDFSEFTFLGDIAGILVLAYYLLDKIHEESLSDYEKTERSFRRFFKTETEKNKIKRYIMRKMYE